MEQKINNKLVMRYHRATGCPVMLARETLKEIQLQERMAFILAVETNPGGIASDPLEDDETIGPIIRETIQNVSERIQKEHSEKIAELRKDSPELAELWSTGRGLCHRIWHETKLELLAEHQLCWRTPTEMNPHIIFD